MKVLHIADVHIRTGLAGRARRADYLEVIGNLLAIAKDVAPVATVVAGDVLHDRSALDPHAVHVFRTLVFGLAELAPVVVIQGNHDHHPQHACPDAPHDVLGELLALAQSDRVVYLKDSGHTVVAGIGFGVVTVHDSVPEGEARSGSAAPTREFPRPMPGVPNVAIYHGSIQGSKSDGPSQGTDGSRTGVPAAWFAGYDAVMLGDQHVQQIGNHVVIGDTMTLSDDPAKPTWAYPGSLVQQNHGESLWNHGAIVWDLEARTVRPVHVRSPTGYVTLKDRFIMYDGAWQDVADHVADPDFPGTVEARFPKGDADEAVRILETAGVSVSKARKAVAQPKTTVDRPVDAALDWRDCVREHMDLDAAIAASAIPTLTEPGLAALVGTRSARIEKLTGSMNAGVPKHPAELRPTRLTWGGLLCYGEGNDVSFFGDGGVVLVSAANGAGKTAFLEVFLIALFGDGFPSRNVVKESAAIINVAGHDAHAELEFCLGADRYVVSRRWSRSIKDATKAVCKSADIQGPGGTICKGKVAVDEWVKNNVCSATDFLSGPMLGQSGDNDVLALNGKDMASFLERAYGLSGIDFLGELLGEATNAYKQIVARADALLNGVDREAYDLARSMYKEAKAAASEIKERMLLVPNAPCPKNKKVNAALALLRDTEDVGEYDPWGHNRDVQALEAVEALEFPSLDKFPNGGSKLPAATVSSMWKRYALVERDMARHGHFHDELLARPEIVAELGKTCEQDTDYGAELDRIGREAMRLSGLERAERSKVDAAQRALSEAETSASDSVATGLVERWNTMASLWSGADPRDRVVLALAYMTSAAGKFAPDPAVLADSVMMSLDVVEQDDFETAAGVLGLERPKSLGVISAKTVAECVSELRDAEDRLAQLTRTKADMVAERKAAEDALQAQVLAKSDEDAIDALKAFESAYAPMKDVDFDAAIRECEATKADLKSRVTAHETAKARSDATTTVQDYNHAKERERLQTELDGLDMERKAMEYGRVRGCDGVMKDYEAIQACKDRMTIVSQAAAKLKGIKRWLYSERIAPDVTAKVNEVVGRVSPGLGVDLTIEEGNVFWTVVDGSRRVSPARASGFQRFMISVALRVVFGEMLAPCSVFVIDEGFTACDSVHLQRVPEFLDWLVSTGHAETVVLVSHLAEIRDHVAKTVDLVKGQPMVC